MYARYPFRGVDQVPNAGSLIRREVLFYRRPKSGKLHRSSATPGSLPQQCSRVVGASDSVIVKFAVENLDLEQLCSNCCSQPDDYSWNSASSNVSGSWMAPVVLAKDDKSATAVEAVFAFCALRQLKDSDSKAPAQEFVNRLTQHARESRVDETVWSLITDCATTLSGTSSSRQQQAVLAAMWIHAGTPGSTPLHGAGSNTAGASFERACGLRPAIARVLRPAMEAFLTTDGSAHVSRIADPMATMALDGMDTLDRDLIANWCDFVPRNESVVDWVEEIAEFGVRREVDEYLRGVEKLALELLEDDSTPVLTVVPANTHRKTGTVKVWGCVKLNDESDFNSAITLLPAAPVAEGGAPVPSWSNKDEVWVVLMPKLSAYMLRMRPNFQKTIWSDDQDLASKRNLHLVAQLLRDGVPRDRVFDAVESIFA